MHREQEKSWFSRNWWWALPGCGCLAVLMLIATMCGGCALLFSQLNDQVFGQGVDLATTHPAVIAVLGEPVSVTNTQQFNITTEGDDLVGTRRVVLEGPNGSGDLEIEVLRSGEDWVLERLVFDPDGGGGPIDLLAEEP